MKIENFRKLSSKIFRFRIAINAPITYDEEGNMYIPKAPKGYKLLRKLAFVIEIFIGYIFIITVLSIFNILSISYDFTKTQIENIFNNHWGIIILKFWLGLMLFFFVPALIGNRFTRIFTLFADEYNHLLLKLERRVHSGTIGLIGFTLISIGTLIKLLLLN